MRRRTFLAGSAALGFMPALAMPLAAQTRQITYGWDADVTAPTQANLYVATTGDDANPGTFDRPLRSIQAGVDALARLDGGSLAIRGGTYREAVSLAGLQGTAAHPFRIHRYGAERVTISAAEVLDGWSPLSAQDAESLGIAPGDIQVARIARRDLAHGSPLALNLHEGGAWCSLAVNRADPSDPETSGDHLTYHPVSYGLDADDHIMALRDSALIGRTAAQLDQVRVAVYHRPNLVGAVDIGGFDPSNGTLTLADQSLRLQQHRGEGIMRYALQNDPLALTPGTWVARVTSSDTISVYFWHRTPGAQIEVSHRTHCLDIGGATHVEVLGIEAVRASGVARRTGQCLTTSAPARNITLHHCRFGDSLGAGERGFGPLYMTDAQDVVIHDSSVGPARGSFGMFLADVRGADLRGLHITGVSNSPARFFGLRDAVFTFSLLERSARDAHANAFNFYQGSDAVLVYGVRTRDVGGYVTYQKASRIAFAFCELSCAPGSQNRALVSQNRGDGRDEPVAGSTFYYWNNSLIPDPFHLTPANALQLGPAGTGQYHAWYNNILHGGGFASIYTDGADASRTMHSHNRYTGLSFWQSPRRNWTLGTSEAELALGVHPGSQGRDMRDVITSLAPLFPGFDDWAIDLDGTPVDWRTPPIGCQV